MKYISRKGNLFGQNPTRSNSPDYILEALIAGFDVMVDVWLFNEKIWLGFEEPTYLTTYEFLRIPGIWANARTDEICYHLLSIGGIHCLHEIETTTLTSNNYMWTKNNIFYPYSIAVLMPGDVIPDLNTCAGVCADDIALIKQDYEQQI